MAPYIFSTGTIARMGRGLNPEARAASGSPGFEPGLVVTFAVLLPTAPLRPPYSLINYARETPFSASKPAILFGRVGAVQYFYFTDQVYFTI